MTKVFVGGSRGVSRLSTHVRMRLDRIMEKELPVIIGDANGADKAVQRYLFSKGYQNVEVFCSGSICRNNVGNWKQRGVPSNTRSRTFDFYAAKDRVMAMESTVGFMVWDGKSIGTLLNVFRLLGQRKKAVVYNVAEGQFHEFKERVQWESFISKCDDELRKKVEQKVMLEEYATDSLPTQCSICCESTSKLHIVDN